MRTLPSGSGDPAPFSPAEIVSVFHRSASYCSRSCASTGRAEMIRILSPRHEYATTSDRPIAPIPIVTNRCSSGAVIGSGLARLIPLEAHRSRVRTHCAYVNPGRCGEMWGMQGCCRHRGQSAEGMSLATSPSIFSPRIPLKPNHFHPVPQESPFPKNPFTASISLNPLPLREIIRKPCLYNSSGGNSPV
jgi:hypothetical protein